MKIGEILDLTLTSNVPAIAKEIEGLNEKSLRALLKELGCEPNKGLKGWSYNGNEPEILERSVYDFIKPKEKNVRTNERMNKNTNEQKKERSIEQKKEPLKEPTKESSFVSRKRASFDIDIDSLKELKIYAIRNDKNVYEIVEQAIKNHIRKN